MNHHHHDALTNKKFLCGYNQDIYIYGYYYLMMGYIILYNFLYYLEWDTSKIGLTFRANMQHMASWEIPERASGGL